MSDDLWELNRKYYDTAGHQAWTQNQIPSKATCNADIAETYASIIVAYLRDAVRAKLVDPAHPVYIVELAAGYGRFAYQCVVKLGALLAASSVKDLDVRFVLTDFTPANVDGWRVHPMLAPLAAAGRMAFGRFDVEQDTTIDLGGGQVLGPGTVKNPIICLGNYAFDSFKTELINVEGGEVLLVKMNAQEDPEGTGAMVVDYEPYTLPPAFTADPVVGQIVEYYRTHITEGTLPLPTGGFIGLRNLLAMSSGRMMLIASDKGVIELPDVTSQKARVVQSHGGGAMSMMVNFHALGLYTTVQGGHWVTTNHESIRLKCGVGIIGGTAEQMADALSLTRERLHVFNHCESWELFMRLRELDRIDGLAPLLGIDYFLGLLRLSKFDPGVLWTFRGRFVELAPAADAEQLAQLDHAITETMKSYFPGGDDLEAEVAAIRAAMARPSA